MCTINETKVTINNHHHRDRIEDNAHVNRNIVGKKIEARYILWTTILSDKLHLLSHTTKK